MLAGCACQKSERGQGEGTWPGRALFAAGVKKFGTQDFGVRDSGEALSIWHDRPSLYKETKTKDSLDIV
jgi:hypothetical protein